MNVTQTMVVSKKNETSSKRGRDEGTYTVETTIDTKFKLIYNKRLKFSSIGKEKVIDVEDTNELEIINDEATVIVNETLADIQKDQTAGEQDTQMIEKQKNMEAPSSHTVEEKDLDIKER